METDIYTWEEITEGKIDPDCYKLEWDRRHAVTCELLFAGNCLHYDCDNCSEPYTTADKWEDA